MKYFLILTICNISSLSLQYIEKVFENNNAVDRWKTVDRGW
jgi:hypothetical protein